MPATDADWAEASRSDPSRRDSARTTTRPQELRLGASGAAVVALQQQLIALGFLAGAADGVFGAGTAQALRDLQRRLLLRPDGVLGPRTQAALAAPPASLPSSPYRDLVLQAETLAATGEASDEKLPILDRGLAASPFHREPPAAAQRLQARLPAAVLQPYPDRHHTLAPYPPHGVVPAILSGHEGRGGLAFLSDAVSQACLCIGSHGLDQPLRVRWYGRRALEDHVQFWSATKFIAGLHVVCQANRRSPGTPIDTTAVHPCDGTAPQPFAALFKAMVDYQPPAGQTTVGGEPADLGDGSAASNGLDGREGSGHEEEDADGGGSNRIGYLFKLLGNREEPDLQTWMQRLSGNPRSQLLGWYGQWRTAAHRWKAGAELRGPGGVLVAHRRPPRNRNLVSAYDLVRMLTLLGWHPQLPPDGRLPGAQWHSLATLVEGLGHDTARYLDVALERLGLLEAVAEPVILSKLGYGAETGDPAIDALTYVAFASFQDIRHRPARQRCFCLALRIPTAAGLSTALDHDARMAAEVSEIVRRIFAEELG